MMIIMAIIISIKGIIFHTSSWLGFTYIKLTWSSLCKLQINRAKVLDKFINWIFYWAIRMGVSVWMGNRGFSAVYEEYLSSLKGGKIFICIQIKSYCVENWNVSIKWLLGSQSDQREKFPLLYDNSVSLSSFKLPSQTPYN